MTNLRCVPDFLIFSDLRQWVAGFAILDSLDTVLPETKEGNADFDLYQRQQSCIVDQDNCRLEEHEGKAGWALDKYKNIHIATKTYHLRPNHDWYVFIDADSYILWRNLAQWLRRLDPSEELYLGSVALINNFRFAHGGSGYILSQAAISRFVGEHPNVANQFDGRVKQSCCGDYMLAIAANETIGLQVKQAWPTINGEKPHTIPFRSQEWCQPIVTMHHMNPEELSSFWNFETRFYDHQTPRPPPNRAILFQDIYREFLTAKLQPTREDWDNLSEDVYYIDTDAKNDGWPVYRVKKDHLTAAEKNAHKSFEDCQKMCDRVSDCFQFRYHENICAYHRGFLLGNPRKREADEGKRWRSGWNLDRINSWVQKQGECGEPLWPHT
ncbi:hypothetical protein F5Y15DRAFT_381091 [Xylariaceae sp. FL0016]|nr:hypothetical protein F5Y15DRAFT_381091 [Xylariaceae sp. FL0016]